MTSPNIKTTYHDALFYATATINEKQDFHLTPAEYRLFLKLIHYSQKKENITWSSDNIGKHLFTSPTGIDKLIQRLKQKGYLNISTTQKAEKVKLRTIFINWDRIIEVNELAVNYNNSLIEDELIIEDEPIFGVYPEQNNEFTKLYEQIQKEQIIEPILNETSIPIVEEKEIQYDYDVMLQLSLINEDLQSMINSKFGKEKPSDDYLEGTFFYVVKDNMHLFENYRSIYSQKNN